MHVNPRIYFYFYNKIFSLMYNSSGGACEPLEIEPGIVNKFPKSSHRVLMKSRWRVKLNDVSCLQHHNSITIKNCIKSMRNSENCTLSKMPPNRRLNQIIRTKEGKGRKKNENFGLFFAKINKNFHAHSLSTELVASSKMRILFFLNNARPKQSSCLF